MEAKKLVWRLIGANAVLKLAFSETQLEGERSHGAQTLFAVTLQIFAIVPTLSKSPSVEKK